MNPDTGKRKRAVPKKRRRAGHGKRGIGRRGVIILSCVLAVSVLLAAVLIYLLVISGREEAPVQEVRIPETRKQEEVFREPEGGLGSAVIDHIITAGEAVDEAYGKRPASHEITKQDAADFASIKTCEIEPDTSRVAVTVAGDGIPASDDKYYYLFALNTYENGIGSESEALAKAYKDNETKLTVSLNYNHKSSRLFKKFVVAVKKDGEFVQVSRPKYITNPEAVARYPSVYQKPSSIKGLLVDPNKLRGNELDDLGVKQAAYNIPLARLLGPTTSAAYPTINYTYNGKTYALNGQVVAEYDLVFSTLTAKGITTTAILLNNSNTAYPQLIHPDARSGSTAPYSMFNGAEETGVEYMAAIGTFLADRYSDSRHGRVSNWIIANEINARKEWNYMAQTDVAAYVEEYAKAFRVFYNAIKSVSGSARVYLCIDQQWDRNLRSNPNYDGRDILDEFNRNITEKGNIDWGLAQHPYNVPLTETRVWKSSKYVTHSADTSMITMANIEVLTNYMQQTQFLNPEGEVRSILLSEQGYSSQAGEALQAAAFAYAYYRAEANPHIDGFLLNRETDAPEEVGQGLSFGLNHAGGAHKQIYDVFKYIDTPQHGEHTEFAKGIIGISGWSEIMR